MTTLSTSVNKGLELILSSYSTMTNRIFLQRGCHILACAKSCFEKLSLKANSISPLILSGIKFSLYVHLVQKVNGQVTFFQSLDSSLADELKSFKVLPSGEMVLAGGLTDVSFGGDADGFVMIRDADGSINWAQRLRGNFSDWISDVIVLNNGGICAVGRTTSFIERFNRGFLIIWDSSKNLITSQTWGGESVVIEGETVRPFDSPFKVIESPENVLYIGSLRENITTGMYDVSIGSWSSEGEHLSLWSYSSAQHIVPNTMVWTQDESLALAGYVEDPMTSSGDVFVMKISPNGTINWSLRVGGDDWEELVDLCTYKNTYLIGCGLTSSFDVKASDLIMIKMALSGELVWAQTLGSDRDDHGFFLSILQNGAIISTGYTNGFGLSVDSAFLSRWDKNGNHLNSVKLGQFGKSLSAVSIATTFQNELVTAGLVSDVNADNSDVFIAQLSNDLRMENCSLVENVVPTVRGVTKKITTSNLDLTYSPWKFDPPANWDLIPLQNISFTESQICQESNITDLLESTSEMSPKKTKTIQQEDKLALIISLVASAAALVGLTTGIGLFIKVKGKKLRPNEKNQEAAKAPPISEVETKPVTRDEIKTTIGGKYALANKITQTEADELFFQTGIKIPFTPGAVKVKPTLGAGQFGKLRVAYALETKEWIAVKKIKGADKIRESEEEAIIQNKLSQVPCIMPLRDAVKSKGSENEDVLYQFMPLAGYGNGEVLMEALKQTHDDILKLKVALHVARSTLKGLAGMHGLKIAHLDLKNSNIVLNVSGDLFIIDFGCSLEQPDLTKISEGKGDLRYFSPQRIDFYRGRVLPHSTLPKTDYFDATGTDLWAIGLMLIELFIGRYPLEEATVESVLNHWTYESMMQQIKLCLDEIQNPEAQEFISLVLTPGKTAAELLNHPLLNNDSYKFKDRQEQSDVFATLKTQN